MQSTILQQFAEEESKAKLGVSVTAEEKEKKKVCHFGIDRAPSPSLVAQLFLAYI